VADPDDTFVGTVNEDFAIESMAGDVFLLGSTSWRIRRVERGIVRVVDAEGATPTIPFWIGEAPARTAELSEEVSALRAAVDRELAGDGGADGARDWIVREAGVDQVSASAVVQYLAAGRAALGVLPTREDIVFERFFDESGGMQLIAHAPFGGRINRALGLLLRKRFCTSFDFELQAAASDDSIVLSLGPQHSFPLEDLKNFLGTKKVHEALIQALLPTPMFQVRWRWNLNRALLVLRFKKGKPNPPQIQRMESDDLMVAIFPSLAQCQDNATGPREIPDHPIVRQTLYDCLNEAMDEPALFELLERIGLGEVRLHFRDTTEPSVLSHEILNSRPYTFLDDAPLEERRTRAVQLRRGLPVEARELGKLDPDAIARVRDEAAPDVRDADELHDLLMTLGLLRPSERELHAFEELVAAARAARVETAAGSFWLALENRRAVAKLFDGKPVRFVPDRRAPLHAERGDDAEAFAATVLRGHLDISGPTTLARLSEQTGVDPGMLAIALARVEHEGFALRGRFDPALDGEQVCSRRLLARIHAYTQERLRREIEPVTAQDFMRFLLRWQRVAPETQLSGRRGVLAVVEQLQGFEVAVAAWEPHVLASRIAEYKTEWLDAVCLSGEVLWGRLSLRSGSAPELRGASLSRATPITLAVRADLPWLLYAARGEAAPCEPTGDGARVLGRLRERGALFFNELVRETGLLPSQIEDGLWDGVSRGLVTADGFQPLRVLLSPASRGSRRPHPRHRGLRRGAGGAPQSEGRWALLPAADTTPESDELAEAVAEQLLSRWGVVFRDVVARESLSLPWREVIWALRRLEARGLVRGGRFVTGFVGEQYALPGAVEALREVRRRERTGELVRVNACDPLNLVGIITPGQKVPALRTNFILFKDGLPLERTESGVGLGRA
jgi:ATP-dependent Lhr-like helicase